ncbi:MAG: hypothetical protein ACR2N0_01905, partial [Rubrobacteraceae bacterium]
MKRTLSLLFLIPLLALAIGVSGSQLPEEDAIERASSAPEISEYADRPTVIPVATYDAATDSWNVSFTESQSGSAVASAVVEDDSGEVSEATPSPEAESATYPELSEEDAIRVATANEVIRE